MELGTQTVASGTVYEMERPLPSSSRIVVEPDAAEFISGCGFQADFATALRRLEAIFNPEKISVESVPGQEDDAPEIHSLAFRVKCDLDHNAFQTKCDYFEPYRSSKPPIYFAMAVLRDL